jgi:hypothetical protein
MKIKSNRTILAASLALACALVSSTSPAQNNSTFDGSFTLAANDAAAPAGGGADADTAAAAEAQQEELAKAAQNPIAKMVSLPFQNNFNFDIGKIGVTQWNLNVQPVIPISLNENWNLITRTIIPIISQPSPADGVPSVFGMGDINPQFYFSPAKPGKLIWGVGPTFTFPTGTESLLTSGKWSMGPDVVLLTIQGHWVYGAVANQQWSYAGWRDKNVSVLTVQPFVNYNLRHGWYLVTAPVITANWEASSDNAWTVPVGGGFGKIFKIGKQPFNAQLQAFDNVRTPEYGASWQLRFQIQLLFPK